MSGVVTKGHAQSWIVASWAYRYMAHLVLKHLDPEDTAAKELARAEETSFLYLDLEKASPAELERFRQALAAAFVDAAKAGPAALRWSPESFSGFMGRLRELLELFEVPLPPEASAEDDTEPLRLS